MRHVSALSLRDRIPSRIGIGVIKMTVGVKRRTHEKVQYCITTMRIEKDAI